MEKLPEAEAVSVKVLLPEALRENTEAVTTAFFSVVPLMVKVSSLVSVGGALVKFNFMGSSGMGRI